MRHLGGAEITASRLTRSDESDGEEQASLRCGPDREIRYFAAQNKMLRQVQAVGKREALSRSPLLKSQCIASIQQEEVGTSQQEGFHHIT